MLPSRKFASKNPAFDTMSTTRKSSCIVSGTALRKWIAASGGRGSVKVFSFEHPIPRITTPLRAQNRSAVIGTLESKRLKSRSLVLPAAPTGPGEVRDSRPADAQQVTAQHERRHRRRCAARHEYRAAARKPALHRVRDVGLLHVDRL